jgi:hypothetical protein
MARMKKFIVKAESWQIFLVFVGVMLVYGIVPDEQQALKIVASILLAVVIFGWFLILGTSLNENLPEDQQKSDTLFVISCFYGILLVSGSAILKDIPIDEDMAGYAIVFVISFGLSFFYVIYFTSTLYASNQERFWNGEKLSAEVIFILFIAFIFGVLILQSRVKRFFT